MTSGLRRRNALALGWSTLLAGLVIPSVMSVDAIVLFWNLPCTERVHWALTPLVAGCEPLSPSRRAFGWTATFLTLLALACATGVAIHGGAAFIRARDKRRALPCLLFPSATLVVAAVIAAVLLSDPDAIFHAVGAWIAAASFAGLATALMAALGALIVALGRAGSYGSSPRTGPAE